MVASIDGCGKSNQKEAQGQYADDRVHDDDGRGRLADGD